MARTYLAQQTDSGTKRNRLIRANKERDMRYRQDNAGSLSRRPVSTGALRRSLTDTQRQYISLAHKPAGTSATPMRPARSKYKKKPL